MASIYYIYEIGGLLHQFGRFKIVYTLLTINHQIHTYIVERTLFAYLNLKICQKKALPNFLIYMYMYNNMTFDLDVLHVKL